MVCVTLTTCVATLPHAPIRLPSMDCPTCFFTKTWDLKVSCPALPDTSKYIASVNDSINPCKAYVDTSWITPKERNCRKRCAKCSKGCFQHPLFFKEKKMLTRWWNGWWSDMKLTYWPHTSTDSNIENVVGNTTKRRFSDNLTLHHPKNVMMINHDLNQKPLRFGQTPPVNPTCCQYVAGRLLRVLLFRKSGWWCPNIRTHPHT